MREAILITDSKAELERPPEKRCTAATPHVAVLSRNRAALPGISHTARVRTRTTTVIGASLTPDTLARAITTTAARRLHASGSKDRTTRRELFRMGTLYRMTSYTLVLLLVALGAPAQDSRAPEEDTSAPAQASGPSQIGFLFVNYYGTDLAELERRSAWISEYDVAVALHLVRRADVDLDEIVAWRRAGSSWDAITRRCGLGCEIYYVELQPDTALSEPYARPYATWDERPGVDLRLTDVEVRELVLLRAMSDYCQASADEIVTLRSAGLSPQAIVADHPPRHRVGATSSAPESAAPPSNPASPPSDKH